MENEQLKAFMRWDGERHPSTAAVLPMPNGKFSSWTKQQRWESWQASTVHQLVIELEPGQFKTYNAKQALIRSLKSSKILKTKQNWVHVMHMLCTGSTAAQGICKALNVDPEGTKFEEIQTRFENEVN